MSTSSPQLLLACEYPVLGLGLAEYIAKAGDIDVTTVGADADDITQNLSEHSYDVLMLDITIIKHDLNSLRTFLRVDSNINVLVLSRGEAEPFITRCMESGARGYISLKCPSEELMQAVKCVSDGEKFLSQDMAYQFAMSSLSKDTQSLESLTSREYQVFTMLAQGQGVGDISKAITLSKKTVHTYRASILSKLDVKNVSELTILALKNGIISIDVID